jgi:hypothetical protein
MKDLLEIILYSYIGHFTLLDQEYVQTTQIFCCRCFKPAIPTLANIGKASAYHRDRIKTKRKRGKEGNQGEWDWGGELSKVQ